MRAVATSVGPVLLAAGAICLLVAAIMAVINGDPQTACGNLPAQGYFIAAASLAVAGAGLAGWGADN